MRLSELLSPKLIESDLKSRDRDQAIRELARILADAHDSLNADEVVEVVLEREALASTGIGEGLAIPHGSLSTVDQLLGAMGRSPKGIDFDSVDGKPARLIFLLVVPRSQPGVHLKTLANITKVLKNADYRNQLLTAKDGNEMLEVLESAERAVLS